MKIIQGKIKFGVVGLFLDNSAFKDKPHGIYSGSEKVFYFSDGVYSNSIPFFAITEEQCAELVDCPWTSDKPAKYKTAKDSLISLVKSQGMWTKQMVKKTNFYLSKKSDSQESEIFYINGKTIDTSNLPDDFLIVKL